MAQKTLRIGEVANQAAVNVQTIRYYERLGLLAEPQRRSSGYREFSPETVQLIRFIKSAQELGFTLTEVEELLRLRQDKSATCCEVREATTQKLQNIDQKIKGLQAMRQALQVLLTSCNSDASTRECPILEALSDVHLTETKS